MKKLNVAIIGQGRSGKQIHGVNLLNEKNVYFNVAYVVDEDEYRREKAKEDYAGCKVFADYRELFNCKDIDLVPLIAKEKRIDCVLSNSFGFGGTNASLVLKRI